MGGLPPLVRPIPLEHHAAVTVRPAPSSAADRSGSAAELALLVGSVTALGTGALLHAADRGSAGDLVWAGAAAVGVVAAIWWVVEAARNRQLGADVVAVLALVGALAVGELLAGAVITVMLASGRALEARAGERAERELRALLERAPRVVHRYEGDELSVAAI